MIPSLHNSINSTKTEGFFACQINEMGKKDEMQFTVY